MIFSGYFIQLVAWHTKPKILTNSWLTPALWPN